MQTFEYVCKRWKIILNIEICFKRTYIKKKLRTLIKLSLFKKNKLL